MTSAGGPGFTSGDDYVAARLSIDIPEDGVQGVRELRDEVERFRITMEAAARSEADHSRYLDQMTEASKAAAQAQSNLTEQVQQYLNVQGQLSGGSSGSPAGGMAQPWSGVSAGMGAAALPGALAGSGSRPASPTDISYQVQTSALGGAAGTGSVATSNPREYLNMQAPRGNINPTDTVNIGPQSIAALADRTALREHEAMKQAKMTGDDPPVKHPPVHTASEQSMQAALDSKIQGGLGLAGQVMNEIGPNGNHVGMANLAMTGLNYAQKKLQDRQAKKASAPAQPTSGKSGDDGSTEGEGGGEEDSSADEATGGASKLLKSIPVIGSVLTGLAGIFGLAQSGGAMIQGMRNMAGVRGGAAGEGFQLDMHQRGLAMDPMISSGQSREVYQALLSEGYSDSKGEGADDVKNFLTNNIKNFNMSVGDSVNLLRMSAKGTKISLGELTDSLSKMREQSKTGYLGQGDIQRLTFERMGQLRAQGATPEDALQAAEGSTKVFANDPELAGTFSNVANPTISVQERLHGGPGGSMLQLPKGLLPGATQEYLSKQGPQAQTEAKLNAYQYYAQHFARVFHDDGVDGSPSRLNAHSQFFAFVQSQEPESEYAQDENKCNDLYDKLMGSSVSSILDEKPGDTADRQAARNAAPSSSGNAARQSTSAHSSNSGSGQADSDRSPTGEQPEESYQQRGNTSSPVIQQQQVIQTTPVTGSVTISLTPEAQRLLSVQGPQRAQLTPIQREANAGRGGASLNSTPVGG